MFEKGGVRELERKKDSEIVRIVCHFLLNLSQETCTVELHKIPGISKNLAHMYCS